MVAYAGIGRAEGDLGQLAKMAQRPDAAHRWRRAKALVIDEVPTPPLPIPPPPAPSPPALPPTCPPPPLSISHLIPCVQRLKALTPRSYPTPWPPTPWPRPF